VVVGCAVEVWVCRVDVDAGGSAAGGGAADSVGSGTVDEVGTDVGIEVGRGRGLVARGVEESVVVSAAAVCSVVIDAGAAGAGDSTNGGLGCAVGTMNGFGITGNAGGGSATTADRAVGTSRGHTGTAWATPVAANPTKPNAGTTRTAAPLVHHH
jgi:hypothetical protein